MDGTQGSAELSQVKIQEAVDWLEDWISENSEMQNLSVSNLMFVHNKQMEFQSIDYLFDHVSDLNGSSPKQLLQELQGRLQRLAA